MNRALHFMAIAWRLPFFAFAVFIMLCAILVTFLCHFLAELPLVLFKRNGFYSVKALGILSENLSVVGQPFRATKSQKERFFWCYVFGDKVYTSDSNVKVKITEDVQITEDLKNE